MYINKAIIYGNLTRDPELRAIPSGVQVATLSVATNRVWKNAEGVKQESVDYHNVVVFGRQAENVAQYLKKGSGIFVEGRMQTRSWDATDGTKKYRTEIVADRVQFGPKSGGGGGNYSKGVEATSTKGKTKGDAGEKESDGAAIDYPEEQINPEDIPF
ncbi:MAG: single-stranded DNA-binding protein [Patescibacteria group bacterium]